MLTLNVDAYVTHFAAVFCFVTVCCFKAHFPFGRNYRSQVTLDGVIWCRSAFSFVGCIQVTHMKCKLAYIHIGYFDIFATKGRLALA